MLFDSDFWSTVLVVLTVIMAMGLLLGSGALAARHFTDIEYQKLTGTNGIRRIESETGVRTQSNRVYLSIVFIITAIAFLLDVDPMIRGYIARVLYIGILLLFTHSCWRDWQAEYKKLKLFVEGEHDTNTKNQNTE